MKKSLGNLIKLTLATVFRKYPGLLVSSVRLMVAKELRPQQVIHTGLFRGVLLRDFTWHTSDRASIIAGAYEVEVQDWLATNVSPGNRNLLNIGAADGLYAIGLLKAGLATRAFCFEMDKRSRNQLAANAALNSIDPDQINVFGQFVSLGSHEAMELSQFSYVDSLFIVDAEGGEYEFVDEDFCKRFSQSSGIIELHKTNDDSKLQTLMSNLNSFFEITHLETTQRNPQEFPLLRDLPDDYRWVTMSEGRMYPGHWLALTPKK